MTAKCTANQPKRAVAYCRVSTDEQAVNYSLPTQEEACRKYAAEHGYSLTDVFRETHTGKVIHRPEMDRLMGLVMARKVDVVVVYKIDRLTRGGADHKGYFLTMFRENGAVCESVLETIDNTTTGQMISAVQATSASQEHDALVERFQRGARAKAKSGSPIGRSRPPFGLRYIAPQYDPRGMPIKRTVNAAFEANPQTIDTLRWMFSQADNGVSLRGIAKGLDALNVPPPLADRTGATHWSPASVREILKNRAYIGEGVRFATKREPHPDPRFKTIRTTRPIDPETGAVVLPEGVYPVVIDPTQFERVQRRIQQNKRESQRADRDPEYGLLRRGIARCGCCNSALGVVFRGDAARAGQNPRYRCPLWQRERHNHESVEISVPLLDAHVWARIKELRHDPRLVERIAARAFQEQDSADRVAETLAALDGRIAEFDARRAKLLRRLSIVDDDTALSVADELKQLAESRKLLAAQREQASERALTQERRRQRIQRSVDSIANVAESDSDLDALSYAEKRRVLLDLGAVISVYPTANSTRWGMTLAFDTPLSRVRAVGNDREAAVWDESGDIDDMTFYLSSRC